MSIRALLEDIGVIFDEADPTITEAHAPSHKKQMVIMVGGPASGKGFFLGEKPGQRGKNLPKSTKNLFKDDDIPTSKVGVAESDNNLRGIQYFESRKQYKALKAAQDKGPAELKKALDDHWYKTKDGRKVGLENFGGMPPVPDPHEDFYKKTIEFYQNMRGWHNDSDETNPETGKPKERFKDKARKVFEEETAKKIMEEDKNFMVIDSAGEDIDAQDFEGQIARGKAAGFEVTVIFLDIDKEDTKLSNMSRGFVQGKRMVDEQDIDNFFDKKDAAIAKIKKAAPNRFLHFKRKPPLTAEERAATIKLMTQTPDGTATFLSDPSSALKSIKDLPGGANGDQAKAVKKGVAKMLYKPVYTLDPKSSFSDSGKDFPAYEAPRPAEAEAAISGGAAPTEKKPAKEPEVGTGGAAAAAKAPKPEDPKARKAAQVADAKSLKPDAYKKKWGRCPNGWRHQGGGHCIPRAQFLKMSEAEEVLEAVDSTSELKRFIRKSAYRIQDKLKTVHDYKLTVEPAGLSVVVRLEGGNGDITALRKIRKELQSLADRAVSGASGGAIKKTKLVASNHREDLVILVEPQYP